MPLLEIQTKLGDYLYDQSHKGRCETRTEVIADIPDEDGTYQTPVGEITLVTLKKSNNVHEIALKADILKGTPPKHKNRRSAEKRVSVCGVGQQTLSKKETLIVSMKNSERYRAKSQKA